MRSVTCSRCSQKFGIADSIAATLVLCPSCKRLTAAPIKAVDPLAAIRVDEFSLRQYLNDYHARNGDSRELGLGWYVAAAFVGIVDGLLASTALSMVSAGFSSLLVFVVTATTIGWLTLAVGKFAQDNTIGIGWRVASGIFGAAAGFIGLVVFDELFAVLHPWDDSMDLDRWLLARRALGSIVLYVVGTSIGGLTLAFARSLPRREEEPRPNHEDGSPDIDEWLADAGELARENHDRFERVHS
jgi:hypothetical protein